jgi:ketosteroid isomerase-like protein
MRRPLPLAGFLLIIGLASPLELNTMANQGSAASDLEMLTRLNADYIASVQKGDVKRFDEILADDFLCSMADGSLIDRKRFLEVTAQPVTIRNLQAHDVNVRLMGDMAIVHAATSFTTADGRPSSGRYTDVWARRGGRWLAVSAHVTRK